LLAAVLALLVSGLGHAYLRRWARAFGWYALITGTLVFVVPDAAVDRVVAGERPPIGDIAPALVAVAASVVDAYVLAVRTNRTGEERSSSTAAPGDAPPSDGFDEAVRGDDSEVAAVDETAETDDDHGSSQPDSGSVDDAVSCPHCGREADATLEFCQWCAEPLDA
jgi:hypothetical protein